MHRDRLLKVLQYTLSWTALSMSMMGMKNAAAASSSSFSTLRRIVESMEKLSAEICWARYVQRLLEWPSAVEAAWTGSWTPSSYFDNNDEVTQTESTDGGGSNSGYSLLSARTAERERREIAMS